MDRLISLEPSNLVPIRIENGQKCQGELIAKRPKSVRSSPLERVSLRRSPDSGAIVGSSSLHRTVGVRYLGSIHLAAGGGHTEVLRLLLLKGANVDALAKDGNTALHLAVEERRRDCARLLLATGARADVRNVRDGNTPLHIAASLGDEYMVKLLLQKGANKDIRNRVGKTAYDVAVEYGQNRLFDILRLGDSLCIASRKGEVRTIQKLLENGAAINGRDQHGWTALHRASFKGKVDAVRALLEKGIDIGAKDEDGYTALHCAAESGQTEVVELLVKKGAEVDSNEQGCGCAANSRVAAVHRDNKDTHSRRWH
ncbi:Ankyrin repeat and protein kinase domain-containing protein 1 [Morella rubra]|uniref:Ankyrin repeat and protein kinase domain-containing protein 1 n=1 Tax=Morella rubra TaxID=262757 RepID=A0A6A1VLE4_9ROSI|nr:Ankyrin repeat and protein kinase domain-containing protein 1 [Morella rubra]